MNINKHNLGELIIDLRIAVKTQSYIVSESKREGISVF